METYEKSHNKRKRTKEFWLNLIKIKKDTTHASTFAANNLWSLFLMRNSLPLPTWNYESVIKLNYFKLNFAKSRTAFTCNQVCTVVVIVRVKGESPGSE